MKRKLLSQLCCNFLMLSFLLGAYRGRLALWKDGESHPCKVFPCPVMTLPKKVQQELKKGIRLDTIEDVNQLLENFVS